MKKTVVVTGASQGVGFGIAKVYAGRGYRVLGVDQKGAHASLAGSENYAHYITDLRSREGCEAAISRCISEFGRLDVLVNNAGLGNARSFVDTGDEDYERYYAINVRPVLRLSRLALEALKTVQGSIVNIASVFGLIGAAQSAAYVPTKYAVVGITRMMATEFGREGVRVNAVAPGLIWSPGTDERIRNNRWWHRMMIEGCPLGRVGQPEEIGEACVFLSSESASFINGVVLPVDGGWSIAKFLPELLPPLATNAAIAATTAILFCGNSGPRLDDCADYQLAATMKGFIIREPVSPVERIANLATSLASVSGASVRNLSFAEKVKRRRWAIPINSPSRRSTNPRRPLPNSRELPTTSLTCFERAASGKVVASPLVTERISK